jgi:hypothetical protein
VLATLFGSAVFFSADQVISGEKKSRRHCQHEDARNDFG